MSELPIEIIAEVVRWQERLDWPELVPAWAEIPDASGEVFWYRYEDLTVALCEQATEFHIREARRILKRWRGSSRGAKEIARHILWSRIYHCRFVHLTGGNADAPFESELGLRSSICDES